MHEERYSFDFLTSPSEFSDPFPPQPGCYARPSFFFRKIRFPLLRSFQLTALTLLTFRFALLWVLRAGVFFFFFFCLLVEREEDEEEEALRSRV